RSFALAKWIHNGKSDELTPTESHSCTKQGGEGSKKPLPGEPPTDVFVGAGACPSRCQHRHLVISEGLFSIPRLPLSPLDPTLTRNGRNYLNIRQITPLESKDNLLSPLDPTLTKDAPVSPLE